MTSLVSANGTDIIRMICRDCRYLWWEDRDKYQGDGFCPSCGEGLGTDRTGEQTHLRFVDIET